MRNWSSRCSHALWSGDQLLKRDSHESLRRMSKAFQFSIGLSGRLVAPLTLSQQPPKRCKGSKHDRPCLDRALFARHHRTDTNNLTLYNTVEQVSVLEAPQPGAILGLTFEVVSFWIRA